jgi:hypothetical protein
MELFLFLQLSAATSLRHDILHYEVNVEIRGRYSYTVHETITVEFFRGDTYFVRYLPKFPGYGSTKVEYRNIMLGGRPFNRSIEKTALNTEVILRKQWNSVPCQDRYTLSYEMFVETELGGFVVDLLGYHWDVPVSGLEFAITCPSWMDLSALSVFSGPVDSRSNAACCQYQIRGNVLIGGCEYLDPYEGLTISAPERSGHPWKSTIFRVLVLISIVLVMHLLPVSLPALMGNLLIVLSPTK